MTAATSSSERSPDRAVAPPAPDFGRPLTCVLGLPFDAIDAETAVERIRDAAFTGRRCFISTPNLNFVMTARVDPLFRGSVLRSDLSLVDGMPLVWIGRFTGSAVHERVSGADVFEALRAHPGPPLNVYFFGGQPGAAAMASENINRLGGGIRCVGYDDAGFGSLESMSSPECIERINRSGAHFVVVSLGAGKGQAWIERNAARLKAPILAHLGAVVNFAAGTIRRAPVWMQLCGMEWLWRIKEEPMLWRRYWQDGLSASRLLATRSLVEAISVRWWRWFGSKSAPAPSLDHQRTARGHLLHLIGDWRSELHLEALRSALHLCATDELHVTVDLSASPGLSCRVTALLLLAKGFFEDRCGIEFLGATPPLRAALRRQLAADALLGEGA